MYPIIDLKIFTLPTYGTIILIGIIIGVLFALSLANIYDVEKTDIVLSSILACVGMLIFAKVIYLISLIPTIIKNVDFIKDHLLSFMIFAFSGYVFYGGLIGAILGYLFYCKWFDINSSRLLSTVIPSIPLIHAFGRVGCFMAGCCYGIEYHGFLHVDFPYNQFVEELNEVSRFPVQLLEASLNLILFIILYTLSRKKTKPLLTSGLYLIIYPIIRFFTEFLRGDAIRGKFFFLTTSQWISLLLIPLGIYLIKKADR